MPTEPQPVSVSDVVHRAVAVVDGTGIDADLGDLLMRFEDADEPIGDPAAVEQRLDEALGALDPDVTDGALHMAGAVATYLAFRRDELHRDPGELVRLAVKAEYHDDPPPAVADYLTAAGF